MKKASPQIDRVREHSRSLVYSSLLERSREKLSRNDITWATGLSNPTVSTVLQEFVDLGLVEEVGQSSARGGRPAQLVSFNAGARCVLSIEVGSGAARALLVDLTGAVLERASGPVISEGDSEKLFDWLGGLHEAWSRDNRMGRIAVALPGVVEHNSGTVHLAPALGWHNYPLAQRLESLLGLPVTLENDVNALAMGELRYGGLAPDSNALFLAVTNGVGMGIVLNGSVYRGSHFAAGEVGYSHLPGLEPQSHPIFGESGPLEAHLLELSSRFVVDGRLDLGAEGARPAFREFTRDLATIVQNAACLLNPDRLTVAWPLDHEGLLLSELQASLSTPMPLEITAAQLGRDASTLGVAAMALDELVASFCAG